MGNTVRMGALYKCSPHPSPGKLSKASGRHTSSFCADRNRMREGLLKSGCKQNVDSLEVLGQKSPDTAE